MDDVIQWFELIFISSVVWLVWLLRKAIKAQEVTVNTQGKTIDALKTSVDAQTSVVDSFKAQSSGVKDFQEMLLRQYTPETFENIVNANRREVELEFKDEIKKLKETGIGTVPAEVLTKYTKSYHHLVVFCACFKLFNSDAFGTVLKVVNLEKFELDSVEMIRKKIMSANIDAIQKRAAHTVAEGKV